MKPSPLDAALRVREQRTEDAKALVGEARRAQLEAAEEHDARKLAQNNHEVATARVEQEETMRLQQGRARAADLAAQASWRAVEAERAAMFKHEAEAAAAALKEREQERELAQAALVSSEVDRKVVETYRDKEARRVARAQDYAADDEMLDAWKPKT